MAPHRIQSKVDRYTADRTLTSLHAINMRLERIEREMPSKKQIDEFKKLMRDIKYIFQIE